MEIVTRKIEWVAFADRLPPKDEDLIFWFPPDPYYNVPPDGRRAQTNIELVQWDDQDDWFIRRGDYEPASDGATHWAIG